MTLTVVDAEQSVRTWARTETHINGAVSTRVFFATPQAYEKTRPDSWVVLRLISEHHEQDDLGMQRAVVEFACWGKTKALAGSVAQAVQQAGRSFLGQPVTVGSTVIAMAGVFMKQWRPDPVTNFPRYIVDLFFDLRGPEAAANQYEPL